MRGPSHRSWIGTALFLGIGYAAIGVLFALPTMHVHAWRWAAWAVSAVGYASHILYETMRLRSSPGLAALHVASAVALGAFGLAVGANIHAVAIGSPNQHRSLVLLALVLWPVITALPAFLVALVVSIVVTRASGRERAGR